MGHVVNALLVVLQAIGPIPSGEAVLQDQGYLEPFDENTSCDQGETHLLWNPCTGVFTFVYFLNSLYDCDHVYVQGPDVGFSELCPMMAPTHVVPVRAACLVQVRNLTVRPTHGGHRIAWDGFGCADSFDVIRGSVVSLTENDVGPVSCVVDDRIQFWVDDLTGPPGPGEALFYLVRPNGPAGYAHYGYSSSAAQRFAASGDCPGE